MKKELLVCASAIAIVAFASESNAKDVRKHNKAKESSRNEKNQNEKIHDRRQEKSVKQEDSAEKPQLIISGSATVHGNLGDPDQTYYERNPGGYEKTDKDTSMPRIVAGEANVDIKAVGKLDNGVEYRADFSVDMMKDDTEVDKMYLSFSKDGWGTLQLGNVKGPASKCVYSGQQLLGGACGLDGTVPHEFDFATGVIWPINNVGCSGKATKIAYYSPRIFGFQIAGAITPDTKHHGHNDKNRHVGSSGNGNDNGMFIRNSKSDQRPSGRNNIELALTHTHEFQNGITTKLSGVYIFEDTKAVKAKSYAVKNSDGTTDTWGYDTENTRKIKLRNTRSYYLSATVEYQKWAFGIGYLNNGKSRTPKEDVDETTASGAATATKCIGNFLGTKNSNAGRAWNVGARYKLDDKWTFSGVFHHMKRKVDTGAHTKGNALTLAVDYKICDGLMVFAEFDHIWMKSCKEACERYNMIFKDESDRNAVMKQHCNLVAVGVKVSF